MSCLSPYKICTQRILCVESHLLISYTLCALGQLMCVIFFEDMTETLKCIVFKVDAAFCRSIYLMLIYGHNFSDGHFISNLLHPF